MGPAYVTLKFVVRFRWRLLLDVVDPYLIGHVAAAHNPVAPRPQMHVCTLPSSQSTPEAPRSHPPKGVGFPDPLSGTLKTLLWAIIVTPCSEEGQRSSVSWRNV